MRTKITHCVARCVATRRPILPIAMELWSCVMRAGSDDERGMTYFTDPSLLPVAQGEHALSFSYS